MQKIGYLVPEFPGQTHIFFWRELQALATLDIDADLVSTRLPPARIISHDWAAGAIARTTYLARVDADAMGQAAAAIARAAPTGWGRCLASIGRAQGLDAIGRARLFGLAALGGRLSGLARSRGWTHVHAHSCGDSAHIAMFANLLSGLPYSVTLHGPLDDYGPNQHEKWRHAAFGLIITQQLVAQVTDRLACCLPPRLALAPMGVDLAVFKRSAPYVPWDGGGPLRLFSCGRLNPGKGHVDLVEAVALLRSRGIDARLAIAGEDDAGGTGYRKTIEARIEALCLDASVELLGAVAEAQIRQRLESAHVFALASLAEPLGVAIMEAMAMALPVVVTNAGGVPELVDDGIGGILIPPRQPVALADAIEAVARDPARAERDQLARRFRRHRHAPFPRRVLLYHQHLDSHACPRRSADCGLIVT